MAPDPGHRTLAGLHFRHPLQARAQQRRSVVQARLDLEHIAPVANRGHRRDALDHEPERVARQRRERQFATLALLHMRDVAFIDLDDQAVLLCGCNRHQCVATLHRSAQRLAQVALDHDTVDRRQQPGAGELLAHQVELGAGLTGLALGDHELGAVGACQRGGKTVFLLIECAFPAALFEHQVLIGQFHQQLAGAHAVARAHVALVQKAVHRRGEHALHRAFDARRRADAVVHRHDAGHHEGGHHDGGHQFGQRVVTPRQTAPGAAQHIGAARSPRALGALAQRHQRPDDAGQAVEQSQLRFARGFGAAPLGQQGAHRATTLHQRNAGHGVAAACGQVGMCKHDAHGVGGRGRVDHSRALVSGLLHRPGHQPR